MTSTLTTTTNLASSSSNNTNNIRVRETATTSKSMTMTSAAANRRIYAKPGSVKERIQLFGGETPLVQRRLDQLTKKWELDANKVKSKNGGKPKPKTEWYASPKSGSYKKRIVYG